MPPQESQQVNYFIFAVFYYVPFILELVTVLHAAFTMDRCRLILLTQLHHHLINRSNVE